MALSAVAKTKRDGTIVLKDGTGTPVTITVIYEDGDLSIEGISKHQTELVAFFDRGTFYTVRKSNQKFVTFKFTAHMTEISDATNTNLYDFINFGNLYSANVSTLGANAEVKTILLLFTVAGTDHGDSTDHTLTLDDCACEIAFSEGEPNKFTITGTSYSSTVTVT
jgi:hypothetical protein